ncbi:lysozyme inhibitor LprI family protein [Bacillus timonensis]|uniref:lysozyme inhibitor LprI family protein n=1 Tax=Bacillus timonensis TaxID=1033734 RepID=UPI000287D177|nr:lysozyme inhibitor LprI family protein [Bacillus timonensis]
MKKLLLLTSLIVLLAACGNTDEKASSTPKESVKSTENNSDSGKTSDKVEVSQNTNEENTSDSTVDSEAPDTSVDEASENSELKNQYLNDLNTLEQEIESKPDGETQIEMEEIAAETYKVWDDELNKIWKELEKQLPKEKMDKLREDQRQWIKVKYEKASEEASEYEGGSMESLVEIRTQAQVTKERCYELVDLYM